MTDNATMLAILNAWPFLGLGLVVGAAFFGLMKVNVALYMAGDRIALAIALNAARLAGAVAAFWWCATQGGPWPLLMALAGFLIARVAVTRLVASKEA